jgi:TonB family protein
MRVVESAASGSELGRLLHVFDAYQGVDVVPLAVAGVAIDLQYPRNNCSPRRRRRKKAVREMSGCRIATWLAFVMLLLGAAAGQQSSVTPEGQASRQSSSRESQTVPCHPQLPTASTPFDTCKYLVLEPGIRPPKAVKIVDPSYPEEARKTKLNGSVVVAVAVNEKGSIDDVKVVRSSDRRFEQNAIDAVRQWKFLPATRDGQPVAVQMNSEMTFKLY